MSARVSQIRRRQIGRTRDDPIIMPVGMVVVPQAKRNSTMLDIEETHQSKSKGIASVPRLAEKTVLNSL